MKKVKKLLENIYLIDTYDLSMAERTGTYVLTEENLTIIETSASPSIPHILEGLKELGYSPADLKYIIVTHIHLDHAGGAGLLLEDCPNAKVIVHHKGKRHLADPSRLIAGAKAVYGEKFDSLFAPILAVPEERLIAMEDRESLTISSDLTLTFYDSPGHANHHFSIFHPKVNGMFTGDTCGVLYPEVLKDGIQLYLPSTSPNQFDPSKMLRSINLFKSKNLKYIFFGHFGMSANSQEVYRQVTSWLDKFVAIAKKAFHDGDTDREKIELTAKALLKAVTSHLDEKGIARNHKVYKILSLDMEVCAMGLIDHISKAENRNREKTNK